MQSNAHCKFVSIRFALQPYLSACLNANSLSKNQNYAHSENIKSYGYIVETFLLPTDAHNVKKHRLIKTF